MLTTPYQGNVEAILVAASGDTVIKAPSALGKRLRVYWIGLSTPQANAGEMLVTVRLGSRTKYIWNMGNPGAFFHRDTLEGFVNESLIVNCSQAYNLYFNYTWEELP